MKNTSTAEGRQQRLEELVGSFLDHGNFTAIVRLIGGSVEDWDERYMHSDSHPDERYQ